MGRGVPDCDPCFLLYSNSIDMHPLGTDQPILVGSGWDGLGDSENSRDGEGWSMLAVWSNTPWEQHRVGSLEGGGLRRLREQHRVSSLWGGGIKQGARQGWKEVLVSHFLLHAQGQGEG